MKVLLSLDNLYSIEVPDLNDETLKQALTDRILESIKNDEICVYFESND